MIVIQSFQNLIEKNFHFQKKSLFNPIKCDYQSDRINHCSTFIIPSSSRTISIQIESKFEFYFQSINQPSDRPTNQPKKQEFKTNKEKKEKLSTTRQTIQNSIDNKSSRTIIIIIITHRAISENRKFKKFLLPVLSSIQKLLLF